LQCCLLFNCKIDIKEADECTLISNGSAISEPIDSRIYNDHHLCSYATLKWNICDKYHRIPGVFIKSLTTSWFFLIFVCSSYIRNSRAMALGRTNQMRTAPAINVYVICSYNSHFNWLASVPFRRKCQVSVDNACLETVHAMTVSNVANVVIIASWLCFAGMPEWT